MCKLLPCENPTGEGVWWRDDTKWSLYNAKHQAIIKQGIASQLRQVDLGTIVSSVHPKGAEYVVDIKKMDQIAVKSRQRRPVRIVEVENVQDTVQESKPPQTCKKLSPPRSSTNLSLNMHYMDSHGKLQRYDPDIEEALLRCIMSGSQRSLLLPDGRSGFHYFDLDKMEQRFGLSNVRSEMPVFSDKAPVQMVALVPWDASAMASIAAKADRCLRRKILVMVIERFRSDEHLEAVLPLKAHPRRVASKTTSTCSALEYDKFVDSVEDVLQQFPQDVVGDLIRSAGTKEVCGGPLQVAFKPVDRLVENPSGYKSKGGSKMSKPAVSFWTSMAAPVAAAHAVVYGCAVQLKILAYLVIVPVSALKKCAESSVSDVCSGYVEVERPEHGLPLAEVTVS